VSGSNTNAHSEGGGITSRQILWGPDADSLAVLLNASHRDAKGFVERGMEPEISYTYTVKSKNSPWAQQGALVPDGGQHHACAAAQQDPGDGLTGEAVADGVGATEWWVNPLDSAPESPPGMTAGACIFYRPCTR
jgi:hypothetical protein